MPIKWSAVQLSDAMDMVEQYVSEAAEPLEQAKIVATEARKIADLAGYVDQHLARLIDEIDRLTGGVHHWSNQPYQGSIRAAIASVRGSIPEGAIEAEQEAEKARAKYGVQQALV